MNDVQMATWLLLITNLPGRNPTLRMRLWRALKATGAGPLRDGVYVLPISEASRRAFEEQATEIKGAGGTAHIVSFEADSIGPSRLSLLQRSSRSIACRPAT